MNTELKHTNILESRVLIVPLPTFNLKNADSINLELAFFIYIGSIQPKSTKLDLIEAKTTMGVGQIGPSMIQIPLFHQSTSICNAKPATCDLVQLWNNAAKLNSRSVIDTYRN